MYAKLTAEASTWSQDKKLGAAVGVWFVPERVIEIRCGPKTGDRLEDPATPKPWAGRFAQCWNLDIVRSS